MRYLLCHWKAISFTNFLKVFTFMDHKTKNLKQIKQKKRNKEKLYIYIYLLYL